MDGMGEKSSFPRAQRIVAWLGSPAVDPRQLPRRPGEEVRRCAKIRPTASAEWLGSAVLIPGLLLDLHLEDDMMGPSVVSRKPHASMRAAYSVSILIYLGFHSRYGGGGGGEGEDTRSPAGAIELPVIEVIATTPLPALGTPLNKVPANVQSLTAEDVEERPRACSPGIAMRCTPFPTTPTTCISWISGPAMHSPMHCCWQAMPTTRAPTRYLERRCRGPVRGRRR